MASRNDVQQLLTRYSPDREALLDYILNDFLSSDEAFEAVHTYLVDEIGIEEGDEADDWEPESDWD